MMGRLIALRDGRAPRRWASGAIVLTLVALILTMPLRVIAGQVPGLTAREAEGTIWAGVLREARIGPVALGSANVRIMPVPLLLGQVELGVMKPQTDTSPAFEARIGRAGASGIKGTIPTPEGLGGLPLQSLAFDGARVRFDANGCREAAGNVNATIAMPGGAGLELAGAMRCSGADLLVQMRGAGGMERLNLIVGRNGRWRGSLVVSGLPETARANLRRSGFAARPGETDSVLEASGVF